MASESKNASFCCSKNYQTFYFVGVDSFIIADLMLYNIEIAQTFSSQNLIKQELFYKSMFNSFDQAVNFLISNGILNEFKARILQFMNRLLNKNGKISMILSAILDKIDL